MSKNRSGGTGCGWMLGFIAMAAALGSLIISGAVGVASVTEGSDYDALLESHDVAGLLVLIGLVALGMARREGR